MTVDLDALQALYERAENQRDVTWLEDSRREFQGRLFEHWPAMRDELIAARQRIKELEGKLSAPVAEESR
jgi:hypothetical protein